MINVPPGWRVETLAGLAAGGIFSDGDWVESKDQDPGGTVRLTQLADVGVGTFRGRSDRWLREDQAARLGCTFLEPGDILIARMPDPIGRACLVPTGIGRAVTVVDVAVVRLARDDIDPQYLMWAFNSPGIHSQVTALQSGTTRKRISRKNLGAISLALPELSEQRRIVGILEDQFSHLDAARDYVDAASRRVARIHESWLRRHLGGDRPPTEMFEVADALIASRGGWSRSRKHTIEGVAGVPYLKMNNITRDGKLDTREIVRVEATAAEIARFGVTPGDILFNSKNSGDLVGKTAVADESVAGWVFNENIMRLRFDDRLIPKFVGIWFLSPTMRMHVMQSASASTNVAAVYMHALKRFPLWVPEKSVQMRLVSEYEALQVHTSKLLEAARTNMNRASHLRSATLAAAFGGGLSRSNMRLDRNKEMASI